MEGYNKNTSFDNLVNYQTFDVNSAKPFEFQQSSADPNCLSTIIKNNQLIEVTLPLSDNPTINTANKLLDAVTIVKTRF
jgi:hypothetical protein